ncbi:MAG: FlgD immunoglobulin-like domain containing protein, partial [candidate division WOR-3 bacterium]
NPATYDTLRLVAKFISYAGAPNPTLIMWALGQTGGVTAVPLPDDKLKFALYLHSPNVLIRGTKIEIKYQLAVEEEVMLGVFDILGREVASLVDARKPRGAYSLTWQGKNSYGKPLACGIYFLRMEAGEFHDIKKLLFLP